MYRYTYDDDPVSAVRLLLLGIYYTYFRILERLKTGLVRPRFKQDKDNFGIMLS